MTDASKSLLGKDTDYSSRYSPELLFPLDRCQNRHALNITHALPFHGEDVWTGYELSWLNSKGKPLVAVADFHFPANSDFMVESKSFKLYLNSLNHEHYNSLDDVKALLEKDLTQAAGKPVLVVMRPANQLIDMTKQSDEFSCVDELDITGFEYQPNPSILRFDALEYTSAKLCSHLLRSNCPVTGQPDWASLYIDYKGPKIDEASLLRYIVSFRECQDFHEHCVERIFSDLLQYCECESLSVYARYTRRGGLDINPYRATFDKSKVAPLIRTIRQ